MTGEVAPAARGGAASGAALEPTAGLGGRHASVLVPDEPERRRAVRALLASEVAPHVERWEAEGVLPPAVWGALGRHGLLGIAATPEIGGAFVRDAVVLLEELARVRASGLGASVLSHAFVCIPLLARHGTPAQRAALLPSLVAGEQLAAIAATEPGVGSDLGALTCRLIDRGTHWELEGEKKYITNGAVAELLLVLARRAGESGPHACTLVLVPVGTVGCEIRPALRTFGLRSSPLGWLRFTRCRVPKAMTLGDPHGGFLYAARQLMVERLLASVGVLALGEMVLAETIAHVRQRRAYGRTLSALQVIRHALVDQAGDLEVLRRFAAALCASAIAGRLEERQICILKIRAAEQLQRLAGVCLQLHGAAGFLEEHWMTRVYRDARAFGLAGGSSAMLKDLIAGYMRL